MGGVEENDMHILRVGVGVRIQKRLIATVSLASTVTMVEINSNPFHSASANSHLSSDNVLFQ